jgi:beta-lactamase regulating signal transducer with metallopeptidase domain/protocatechuate 3,4-dioxygenase beta subunit/peroxiredoxin
MNYAIVSAASVPGFDFVLDLAARATTLLVVGLVVQQALARSRAALGSAVGNACLIGLLVLPLAASLLPKANYAWRAAAEGRKISPAGAIEPPDSLGADRERQIIATSPTMVSALGKAIRKAAIVPSSSIYSHDFTALASRSSAPAAGSSPVRRFDWLVIGLTAYLLVAVVLLARVLSSLVAVARLRHASTPVDNRAWWLALEGCRRRLGIDRPVSLACSPLVAVPVVLGAFRPSIVLPTPLFASGPDSHSEAILLHELTHVRRGDYRWNMILHLVQAVYWPHPLVWLLGRALADLRERACDDLCVAELGGPSAYREALLAVAGGLSHRASPALGLAMARRSRLRQRLDRIDKSRGDARCLPSLSVRMMIAAIAVAATIMVGVIQVTRAQADPPKQPQTRAGRVFHLQVVAADTRQPVPTADVRIWIAFRDEWKKTDAQGRLDIVHSTGPSNRHFTIDVWGDGRAMQRHNWGLDPNKPIPQGETITLLPGELLGGIVQDEQGRPVGGAAILLWSHNYRNRGSGSHELLFDLRAVTGADGRWRTSGAPQTTGELLGFRIDHPDFLSVRDYGDKEVLPRIADLRAEKAVTVMKKGVPIEGRVIDDQGKPVAGARVLSMSHERAMFVELKQFAVFTDSEGRFRTGQVKAGEWFLVASAAGHGPGDGRVKVGKAVPQVEIMLGRPRTFKGRVLDLDGKPIAGAFVDPDTWKGRYRCLGAYLWTDADGRFRWDEAPSDELMVNVSLQGYDGVFQQRVSPTAHDVVFRLEPRLPIQGTVRDVETKKRVENATLDYGAVDPKTGEVAQWTGPPRLGFSTGVAMGQLNLTLPVTADGYKIRIQSPGYQTFISRVFRRDEKAVTNYEIMLTPGTAKGPMATVRRPDGKPLAGARVHSGQPGEGLSVDNGVVDGHEGGRDLLTGPDGSFPIPQLDRPFVVLILGDDAYAIATKKTLSESPRVRATPYGRIEGRYFVGNRPIANQSLQLSGLLQGEAIMSQHIFFSQKTTTGLLGGFTFDRVIPMSGMRVGRRDALIRSIGEPVHVAPGETTLVTIGGRGRPVIGRAEVPRVWNQPLDFTDRCEASFETNRPDQPFPLALFRGKRSIMDTNWSEWMLKWNDSPEGVAYQDSRVSVSVPLSPDGSFRVDDLPAGEYRLAIHVNEPSHRGRDRGPIARAVREFRIPPMPEGRSDEPLDIGVVQLEGRRVLKIGDPAPPFAVTAEGGKALSLNDYGGKFLLLDFGTTWDQQSRLQVVRLNDLYQRFAADKRFALVSLVMAPDNAATREFIAEKGEPWPQAIIGPLSNPIAALYGVEDISVPSTILIGPDGKVKAIGRYSVPSDILAKALAQDGK